MENIKIRFRKRNKLGIKAKEYKVKILISCFDLLQKSFRLGRLS